MRYGVVGARRRFRVILHAEYWQCTVPDSLDGPVIQVDVSDLEVGRSGNPGFVSFDREAVILGGDQHATGLHFLHRMISAAMTVGEFFRRATERESQELMTEANSENRSAAD